jgi:hypothetical protein
LNEMLEHHRRTSSTRYVAITTFAAYAYRLIRAGAALPIPKKVKGRKPGWVVIPPSAEAVSLISPKAIVCIKELCPSPKETFSEIGEPSEGIKDRP